MNLSALSRRATMFYLVVLLFFPLLFSCRKPVPEDISLPYAKKKFTARTLADSLLLKDSLPEFILPFLWLESDSFAEEQDIWLEKQYGATRAYLNALSYGDEKVPSSLLFWKNGHIQTDPRLFHTVFPVSPMPDDTLSMHLFYRENSFENGQNPTVLIPYNEHIRTYLTVPDAFFETGGILAVLGEPEHVIIRDSSRFFAKCDSLARWIWRDTAQSALHRRNYRLFRYDSLMVAKYTRVSEMDLMPRCEPAHLIKAANLLIAAMYTTPAKMALLAVEDGDFTAENTLFLRNNLFRAAVFDIRQDTSTAARIKEAFELGFDRKKTAVLMNDIGNRRAEVAYIQDRMQRKTGSCPFLITPMLDPRDAWRFILYHIAKEEKVVEVR